MPTPNPTTRREYKGAAAATTLTAGITSGATTFTIASSAGWPTGGVGNFIVTIDRGQATEERIKCSLQSAGTVTVAASGRGFDSTTAQAHANGAAVEHTGSAFDADEWNQHTNAVGGVHGVATVAGLTEVQTFTNKTLTSPTINTPAISAPTITGTTTLPAGAQVSSTGTGIFTQLQLVAAGSAVVQMGSTGGIAPNPPAGTVYLYFSGTNLRCRFPNGTDTILA